MKVDRLGWMAWDVDDDEAQDTGKQAKRDPASNVIPITQAKTTPQPVTVIHFPKRPIPFQWLIPPPSLEGGRAGVGGKPESQPQSAPEPPDRPSPPALSPPAGRGRLARGATGPEVVELQVALERAGYGLPRYGADGRFGQETANALMRFQTVAHLPATGVQDDATWRALTAAGTHRSPDYQRLFADGVLKGTLAVGHDEAGWHHGELEKLRTGLARREFRPLDLASLNSQERTRLGIPVDASGEWFTRRFTHQGNPVTAVLELVTPDSPDARQRFARGISGNELVLYGGHGRYGSGPDFDDIHSPDGNYVIGKAFEPGHVTVGPEAVSGTDFTQDYQLFFFDGCNTYRYFDDLRAKAKGKSSASLDVIGSTTELFWDDTADNLFTTLDAVMAGRDFDALSDSLDRINRRDDQDQRRFFVPNGFQDNPDQ